MTSAASAGLDAHPDITRALAEQYARRHAVLENYFSIFSVPVGLMRRLGIEPHSTKGYLAMGLETFLIVLLPALILTFLRNQWSSIPLVSWIIVSMFFAFELPIAYVSSSSAVKNINALPLVLSDEEEIRKMLGWERRWYCSKSVAVVAGTLTLVTLVALLVLQRLTSVAPLPAGTLWIWAVLSYTIGEAAYSTFMISVESRKLSSCQMNLYGLSPIDSSAIQRALHGYNQIAAVNILLITPIVFGYVITLPGNSALIVPVVVTLLLVVYFCSAFGTLVPRAMVGRIVHAKKREGMNALQPQLNSYLARVRELSDEEYAEMQRLRAVHDAIRDSPDNLLSLGWLARVIGALLLTTITVILTTIVQSYASAWLSRIVP